MNQINDDIEERIVAFLHDARESTEQDSDPAYMGLTPYNVWNFMGVQCNAEAGVMTSPTDGAVDHTRFRGDFVRCNAIYCGALRHAECVADAISTMIEEAFGPERQQHLLTFQHTMPDVNTLSVVEACRAVALGLQSTFTYHDDVKLLAIFSLTDAIALAQQQASMTGVDATHVQMLNEELILALPEHADEALFKVQTSLPIIGRKVLRYLFR